MTRMATLCLAVSLLLSACKVEPAPEDLDGLAHWFWQHLDDEDSAALQEGAVNLYAALDGASFEGPLYGTISTLSIEELGLVGHGDESNAEVYGVILANDMDCSTAGLEYQIYSPDQAEMHPSTYVSYDRVYTTDRDAYEARENDWLEWQSRYVVEGLGANYSATINGGLRYVADLDDHEYGGPVLVARGVLDEPAPFGDSDTRGIFQDYQLEIYFPMDTDRTMHVYAVWREMVYLSSATFGDGNVQDFTLEGLYAWDEDAMDYCGVGP